MDVAHTILQQLGGNKFIAMTGARGFIGGEHELQFSLTGRINKVRIVLEPSDTYRVQFYRVRSRGLKCDLLHDEPLVYADQLGPLFESVTGLRTSL